MTNAVKALLRAKEYKNALDLAFTCNWPWLVFKNASKGEHNAQTYLGRAQHSVTNILGYWMFCNCSRCGWMTRPSKDSVKLRSAAIKHNQRCMKAVYDAVKSLSVSVRQHIRVMPGPAVVDHFWAHQ